MHTNILVVTMTIYTIHVNLKRILHWKMIHSDLTISAKFWEWPRVFAQTHYLDSVHSTALFARMNPLHSSY